MNYENELRSEYLKISSQAKSAWSQKPKGGRFLGLPAGYQKIAVSMGSKFSVTPQLNALFDDLEALAKQDSAIALVPRSSAHFTFLALSGHSWDSAAELPPEARELKNIINPLLEKFTWKLTQLQLIAGPNFLLLGGFPEPQGVALRLKLAETLRKSVWKAQVEARYTQKGFTFPPLIWHSTLCRYPYEVLPLALQKLYLKYENQNFGSVDLASPLLRAINYDWSASQAI